MTLKKAYKILKRHNSWRRDEEGKIPMQHPKEIGEALDTLLAFTKELLNNKELKRAFKPSDPSKPKPQ